VDRRVSRGISPHITGLGICGGSKTRARRGIAPSLYTDNLDHFGNLILVEAPRGLIVLRNTPRRDLQSKALDLDVFCLKRSIKLNDELLEIVDIIREVTSVPHVPHYICDARGVRPIFDTNLTLQ
jgi:hypothetical protein